MRISNRTLLRTALVLGSASVACCASPDASRGQSDRPAADARWKTVRDFGAIGDGNADDTKAIQKAVDSKMGDIRFPRGIYRITKPIEIDLVLVGPVSVTADGTARVVMAAAGPALRFVGTHQGTADPHTVKENVWLRQRTPVVDGLEIVGEHPDSEGMMASETMQLTVTRVTVREARHGIHLVKRNRNVIVSECHLYNNRGIGLFMDKLDLHQVNVTNCHIFGNGGGGIVARESQIRNLQIGSCDIEANMSPGGPPTANILFDTIVGAVREGAIVGCTIQHTHRAPGSANIRFIGRGAEEPRKVGNFCIANNAMNDTEIDVHLQNAQGVTITGNTFWLGFRHNILAEGSSHIVLGPNLFHRNTDYAATDAPNGLVFRDCSDCTLTGLHINNTRAAPAALVVRRCKRFNVTGCTILDCDSCGILLDEVESVRVSDCIIQDNRVDGPSSLSLKLIKGRGNMIVNNLLNGDVEIASGAARVAGNYDVRENQE